MGRKFDTACSLPSMEGYHLVKPKMDDEERQQIEGNIRQGLEIFAGLKHFSTNWPYAVRIGATPFSQELEDRFLHDIAQWLKVTAENLGIIEAIEAAYGYRALKDADDLLYAFWEANSIKKNWTPPVLTIARGLRHESLTDEESDEIHAALRNKTACPAKRPVRLSEQEGG
jgi:hypothetical protein